MIMKRKHRKFKTKYFFINIFYLVPLLILILLLGISGLNAGVQASDSVLGPNFNEYRDSRFGFASFDDVNILRNNISNPEFNLERNELELNILDPTKSLFCEDDGDSIWWNLQTNNWRVQLNIQSIGPEENDKYADLTQPYTNEFFRYTFKTDGEFAEDQHFFPGGEMITLSDIDENISGTIKFEYDASSFKGDRPWCAIRAGKYRDIIEITISGEMMEPDKCETAWAYGGEYAEEFYNIEGISSSNWGWSNGPLKPEGKYYIFDLWAEAGLNNLGNGTKVGTLKVDFAEEKVIYNLDSGFSLSEVHLYIGNNHPTSAAPGILGYNSGQLPVPGVNSYEIDFYEEDRKGNLVFSGVKFDDDIYVAAHAKVCWYEL